jgi:hypothetical protein
MLNAGDKHCMTNGDKIKKQNELEEVIVRLSKEFISEESEKKKVLHSFLQIYVNGFRHMYARFFPHRTFVFESHTNLFPGHTGLMFFPTIKITLISVWFKNSVLSWPSNT